MRRRASCSLWLAVASSIGLVASLVNCGPGSGRARPGRYATPESVAQLAADKPCEYLATVHKLSREVVERLLSREQINLDEYKCMAEAIVDVNWEVGLECHRRRVKFEEMAALQKERYRECLSEEHIGIADCAVIQIDEEGSASYCR